MTTRPGRFKKWIKVDIPRPRYDEVKSSKPFLDIKKEVVDAIHEEAVKSFERGEREMA